jgi:hypothetical protein
MMREEILKPLAGPIGALGISSETSADLGKERRTITIAPPGEMLMAVANSRESLPFPSRVRIKTGMASCNRAHLRSSFFDRLRGTRLHHPLEVFKPRKAPQGPNLERGRPGAESLQTSLPTRRLPKYLPPWGFVMTTGQTTKVQRFSLRCLFRRRFQLTAGCT